MDIHNGWRQRHAGAGWSAPGPLHRGLCRGGADGMLGLCVGASGWDLRVASCCGM